MFAPQEFLTLIGTSYQSGVVVNIGHNFTSVVPIWNLNILRDKAVVSPVRGEDVTQALELLLHQNRSNIFPYYQNRKYNWDRNILDPNKLLVEHIKEKLAYVAEDYTGQLSESEELKHWELPDGNGVRLGRELFQCSECLFNPGLFGLNQTLGLINSVNDVIDSLYC